MPAETVATCHGPPPTAVVKLGGSLLDMSDLAQRLDVLRPQWGGRPLIVVGGGPAADLVRAWDHQHQLGEERSHWLALDSLELTGRLFETLWPSAHLSPINEIEAMWQAERIPLVRPREWFERTMSQGGPSPPQTWETTTDTIAAWIATQTHAESLWLLKSISSPSSLIAASQQELVDPQFIHWVPNQIPLHWVNMRGARGDLRHPSPSTIYIRTLSRE